MQLETAPLRHSTLAPSLIPKLKTVLKTTGLGLKVYFWMECELKKKISLKH
jgi:hypothetical protein